MKRNSANPSDVLRLLKQPVGATRLAVRAADYMDNAVKLIRTSLLKRQKRSINATGAYAKMALQKRFSQLIDTLPPSTRSDLRGGPAPHCRADRLLRPTTCPLLHDDSKSGHVPHHKRRLQPQVRRGRPSGSLP